MDLRSQFARDGFVFIKNLFDPQEAESFLQTALDAETKEHYPNASTGRGMVFRSNLFFKSPKIQDFISQQKLADLFAPLVGPNIWARWDNLAIKQPMAAELPWHQDNSYSQQGNTEHVLFWLALTDMTKENGSFWLVPGSHKRGYLQHEYGEGYFTCQENFSSDVHMISAKPGDALIFSSLLVHKTEVNSTQKDRIAYILEVFSTEYEDKFVKGPYFHMTKDGKPLGEFHQDLNLSTAIPR